MQEHGLDVGDVGRDGGRARTFGPTLPGELYDPLTVEDFQPDMAEPRLELVEGVDLRPAKGLADLQHVRDVEVDELGEGREVIRDVL